MAIKEVEKTLPHLSVDQISELIAGTSSKAYQVLLDSEKALVVTGITSAIKCVWLLFMVAAAISFVCSFPLARVRLGGSRQ
ncbi:hypothetical protein NW762_014035 [Fusarium torreyae]|uniref:Uncharacterized protein n=1 Tax=Fusarium torreyae TaxID=1237075 RepID=A0A9W8RMK5_9HYPO|nr:hypothetical protein NW762_014035 [Fusarium torreyae]